MNRRIKFRLAGLLVILAVVALGAWQTQQNFPLPTGLSFSLPTLTISSATNGNGVLALSGNTSGTATLTAPSVAGTTTNAVVSSNNLSAPALVSTVATGTAPISATSTTPVANLTVSNHPQMQFCGTTSACSHTALTAAQIVWGSAPLVTGTPSTVTISGISPAFSSTTSYKCLLQDQTTAANDNAISVSSYASGSSFVITGPATNTDTIVYVCVGN